MNDLGALTVKLVMLAIPGLIASRLYRKLKGRRPRENWEDLVEVLIFSALGYGIMSAAAGLAGWAAEARGLSGAGWWGGSVAADLLDPGASIRWAQVLWTAPVGVALGYAAAWTERHQLIYALGKRVGAVAGGGDYEEWLAFNNERTRGRWVYVHDHRASIVYVAGIDTFSRWSNAQGEHELILERVRAYSEKGELIAGFRFVHLARRASDLTISIPGDPVQRTLFGAGLDPDPPPADTCKGGGVTMKAVGKKIESTGRPAPQGPPPPPITIKK